MTPPKTADTTQKNMHDLQRTSQNASAAMCVNSSDPTLIYRGEGERRTVKDRVHGSIPALLRDGSRGL